MKLGVFSVELRTFCITLLLALNYLALNYQKLRRSVQPMVRPRSLIPCFTANELVVLNFLVDLH